MKASRIESRSTACSAGSSLARARASGIGSTHIDEASGSPSGPSTVPGSPMSTGRARRLAARSMSKHTLEAIRYSQVRTLERPSKRSNAFHARVRVSWTASSASKEEPSIR